MPNVGNEWGGGGSTKGCKKAAILFMTYIAVFSAAVAVIFSQ